MLLVFVTSSLAARAHNNVGRWGGWISGLAHYALRPDNSIIIALNRQFQLALRMEEWTIDGEVCYSS